MLPARNLWTFSRRGKPLLKGEPQTENGFMEISDAPGFSDDLDEELLSVKAPAALVW